MMQTCFPLPTESSYRSHFKAIKITIFSNPHRQLHRASSLCSFKPVLHILKAEGGGNTVRCPSTVHSVPPLMSVNEYGYLGITRRHNGWHKPIQPLLSGSTQIRKPANNCFHTGRCQRGASVNRTDSRETQPSGNGKGSSPENVSPGKSGNHTKTIKTETS